MKEHIIQLFKYNDWANKKLLEAILQLPEKDEAVRLFSHLIAAQNKWMARVQQNEDSISWFDEPIELNKLLESWIESINTWIAYLEKTPIENFNQLVVFTRPADNKKIGVSLIDLSLQLNYHNMHHRAQINTLISKQGIKPPTTDYIYTKFQLLD